MKPLSILAALGATMCLSSCSILKSAVQVPLRTLQGVSRTIGVGIEHSEEQSLQKTVDAEAIDKKIDAR
ncbi:MAG: hypothetical protein QNL33_08685 [Akkermansiaceae bacterium]|jgi:hypothetical protein